MRTIRSILENGPELHRNEVRTRRVDLNATTAGECAIRPAGNSPSAADLDAVAEEERIKRETAKPTQAMRHARKHGEAFQKMCRQGAFR